MKLNGRALFVGVIAGFVGFLLFSSFLSPWDDEDREESKPPVRYDTIAEPADEHPLLPSTPPPAIQQEEEQEQQPEFPEEVITARDICQSLAITYDVTTVKDLKKLPLRVQPDWARNRCAEVLELELVAEPVVPTLLGVNDCAQLKEAYQVVRANNWGGLPVSMYGVWIASKCDELLANQQQPQQEPGPDTQPTDNSPQQPQEEQKQPPNTATGSEPQPHEPEVPKEQQPEQQPEQRPEQIPEQSQREDQNEEEGEEEGEEAQQQPAGQSPLSATGGIPAANAARCKDMMVKYNVQPGGKSWGSMSQNMQKYWKSLRCEQWYWSLVLARTSMTVCPTHNRNAQEIIAILAATTTRKISSPNPAKLALCRWLLPSVVKSLDCGFRFKFVLGYDEGDQYFDTPKGLAEITEWFEDNVQGPLEQSNIIIELVPVRFKNELKKPGPIFLEMAKKAYQEGADYFYRLNDDTQLVGRWPNIYVQALKSLGEPYGVVGPVCRQGNPKILTHDFTHRTHMEIFDMKYYPPELTDWWMDDWISFVYGSNRTIKATATEVIHHTSLHGRRYTVDKSHKGLVDGLVTSGREAIRKYMVNHNLEPAVIKQFDQDTRMGHPYNDFVLPSEAQSR